MNLPDFLSEWPHGQIVLAGHRIGLYHVVMYYNEGYSPEMLLEQFPTLTPEEVGRVIDYYGKNKGEIDAYVAACRAEVGRQAALPQSGPGREELQRRRESSRAAESA